MQKNHVQREIKNYGDWYMRGKFMSNGADNKTPREFFRITSGLLSCVIHGGLVWPDKNVRPACALANAVLRDISLDWKNGFAGGGIRRPRNAVYALVDDESPSPASTRARVCIPTYAYTYNGAFVTRCTWLARVILVRFAGFWTNVRTHIECKRRITRSRTFNRDYCES